MYIFNTQQTAQTEVYEIYLVGRGPILYTTLLSQVGRVFSKPEPLLVYANEVVKIFVSSSFTPICMLDYASKTM